MNVNNNSVKRKDDLTDYYDACVTGKAVVLRGDGEPRIASNTIRALQELKPSFLDEDSYSVGGEVEKFEKRFSEMLGKESAIFMPTGTLANHIAIRKLCGVKQKVIVQQQSHLYNDCGDSVTRLSGISLLPLGFNETCFTIKELTEAVSHIEKSRVATQIGALMIESPVRRKFGQVVSFDQMQDISQFCLDRGYSTHLDGARLFMMSGSSGFSVQKYCDLFDTVYVSLYKYFGAPFGAILAGSNNLLEDLHHERRMFGGSLPSSYLSAALSLRGVEGFESRFVDAMKHASKLLDSLDTLKHISIKRFENGSNMFPVELDKSVDVDIFVLSLRRKSIFIYPDDDNSEKFTITVNTTILRQPHSEIFENFRQALLDAS